MKITERIHAKICLFIINHKLRREFERPLLEGPYSPWRRPESREPLRLRRRLKVLQTAKIRLLNRRAAAPQ